MAPKQKLDLTAAKADNPYNITGGFAPFIEEHPDIEFVFVQWLDFLGMMRSRCLPVSELEKLVKQGERIAISNGNLGTIQNDTMSSVCNPVGAIYVEPDASMASLRPMQDQGPVKNAATIMSRFLDENGKPLNLCPRSSLQGFVEFFEEEYHVQFLVGFEIEITFCKRTPPGSEETFEPLDTIHAWGTFSDEQYINSISLMLHITRALQKIGVEVQQMHSEAGAGQYEFVLPPLPPIQAVDTLIQARQCITQIAAAHGLRATCHPQPFPGIGTAAHAHISFNSKSLSPDELGKVEKTFMAAILRHMPALCAFTMPQLASYGRVVDDSWTGGTWIAWGTQNREVPLRKSGPLRWEIRFLDGCANMYLALAAIFAAGLRGVRHGEEMKLQDCQSTSCNQLTVDRRQLGLRRIQVILRSSHTPRKRS